MNANKGKKYTKGGWGSSTVKGLEMGLSLPQKIKNYSPPLRLPLGSQAPLDANIMSTALDLQQSIYMLSVKINYLAFTKSADPSIYEVELAQALSSYHALMKRYERI